MEHQEFVHQSLDQHTDEIRLISILPSQDPTTVIEAEITHAQLSQLPKYEALSYMWGMGDESEQILIQGKKYGVRENLWLALQQLRLKDKPRSLWIDAICINQDDIIERNHQVDQMSRTFSQAEQVVVWIGPSTSDSDDTISFVKKVDETIPFYQYKKMGYLKYWDSLLRLCQRPYWSRLWIIQEVVLAPRILLRCGLSEVNWSSFIAILEKLRAAKSFREASQFEDTIPERLSKFRALEGEQLPLPKSTSSCLLDLFFKFQNAECQDNRDRFFGLLSLANNCCRESMPPDYSRSAFDICQSALEHYLKCHHSEPDIVRAMKLSYRAHSTFKKSSEFGRGRTIYRAPLKTISSRYRYSRDGNSKNQILYLLSSWANMRYPMFFGEGQTAFGLRLPSWVKDAGPIPSISITWEKMQDYDIQDYIFLLLSCFCVYPETTINWQWPNSKALNLQITLDENGFIAVTNSDLVPGTVLYTKEGTSQARSRIQKVNSTIDQLEKSTILANECDPYAFMEAYTPLLHCHLDFATHSSGNTIITEIITQEHNYHLEKYRPSFERFEPELGRASFKNSAIRDFWLKTDYDYEGVPPSLKRSPPLLSMSTALLFIKIALPSANFVHWGLRREYVED